MKAGICTSTCGSISLLNFTGAMGVRQRVPGDDLDDIDGDEEQKTAADENKAENGERQKDIEKDAHDFEDDQWRIPSGLLFAT